VLGQIFAAVLAAMHGVGAPPSVLHRPAPPPLVVDGTADRGPFSPPLSASAYVAVDLKTGRVIFARNPTQRRPIASLTKVMTGILAAEAGDPQRRVRVPLAATRVEPTRDDLVAGHRYTRSLLLTSALMISANDSAYTLAHDLGGGSLPRFYATMNAAAASLGMTGTHYASPSGLDDVHNRSTALDQALVARYALGDPAFAAIVRRRVKFVPWARPVLVKEYRNHNRMLFGYAGTYGVKTGYTIAAGACLIVAVRRGGHDVLGVLLHSNDIWADMPRLIDATLRRAS
jgi:D-alanyl-D-alanine carboxypeptidase